MPMSAYEFFSNVAQKVLTRKNSLSSPLPEIEIITLLYISESHLILSYKLSLTNCLIKRLALSVRIER